jgi:hypothetical protein
MQAIWCVCKELLREVTGHGVSVGRKDIKILVLEVARFVELARSRFNKEQLQG